MLVALRFFLVLSLAQARYLLLSLEASLRSLHSYHSVAEKVLLKTGLPLLSLPVPGPCGPAAAAGAVPQCHSATGTATGSGRIIEPKKIELN